MTQKFKNIALLIFMLATAWLALESKPNAFLADERPKLDLESIIPSEFSEWRELRGTNKQIINPQVQEKLNELYNQILVRSYANSNGEYVMLSIAYGRDQRSYMAAHYPEACYPAQGFTVSSSLINTISTKNAEIQVRRLETNLGKQRFEPVTYWTTIGDYSSLGGLEKRLIELQYGLEKKIPDGLIFRVSSIGNDSKKQFDIQDRFVRSLLQSVSDESAILLIGKSKNSKQQMPIALAE